MQGDRKRGVDGFQSGVMMMTRRGRGSIDGWILLRLRGGAVWYASPQADDAVFNFALPKNTLGPASVKRPSTKIYMYLYMYCSYCHDELNVPA